MEKAFRSSAKKKEITTFISFPPVSELEGERRKRFTMKKKILTQRKGLLGRGGDEERISLRRRRTDKGREKLIRRPKKEKDTFAATVRRVELSSVKGR